MKYRVTLTAVFDVEAENVVQAIHATKRVCAVGEVTGGRKAGKHERDMTRYSVTKLSEKVRLEKT